jgi:hypothetical protein
VDDDDDSGGSASVVSTGLAVDLVLCMQFALVHSALATRVCRGLLAAWLGPLARVGAVFATATSLLVATAPSLWVATPLHRVWLAPTGSFCAVLLSVVRALAWAVLAGQSFCYDHWELFGLRQVWRHSQRQYSCAPAAGRSPRHPVIVAWATILWLPRAMTLDRLLFAAFFTAYPLVVNSVSRADTTEVFHRIHTQFRSVFT